MTTETKTGTIKSTTKRGRPRKPRAPKPSPVVTPEVTPPAEAPQAEPTIETPQEASQPKPAAEPTPQRASPFDGVEDVPAVPSTRTGRMRAAFKRRYQRTHDYLRNAMRDPEDRA